MNNIIRSSYQLELYLEYPQPRQHLCHIQIAHTFFSLCLTFKRDTSLTLDFHHCRKPTQGAILRRLPDCNMKQIVSHNSLLLHDVCFTSCM